jgi:hypothetical protein
MTRCAAILALLLLVSCKEKPKPVPPHERGAAFFTPAAEKLSEVLVAELSPEAVKQYLEETKSSDTAALRRVISGEIMKNFAAAMSLTEAQEADLKAGKYADADNLKRVRAAAAKFADTKVMVPKVCQVALLKVESGTWKSGLQLEFAARLLEGHLATGRH